MRWGGGTMEADEIQERLARAREGGPWRQCGEFEFFSKRLGRLWRL